MIGRLKLINIQIFVTHTNVYKTEKNGFGMNENPVPLIYINFKVLSKDSKFCNMVKLMDISTNNCFEAKVVFKERYAVLKSKLMVP